MGNLKHVFFAILVAISAFSVVFCLIHSKGASHKKLVIKVSTLLAITILCFGGQAVLTHFNMGWRCTSVNTMLLLSAVLFVNTLWHCMNEFTAFEDVNHALVGCGFFSILLVLIITLPYLFGYFHLMSWYDTLSTYDGQTIVCASDAHGGSGAWRYYTHINSLVHGVEITQDSWWGMPPFQS